MLFPTWFVIGWILTVKKQLFFVRFLVATFRAEVRNWKCIYYCMPKLYFILVSLNFWNSWLQVNSSVWVAFGQYYIWSESEMKWKLRDFRTINYLHCVSSFHIISAQLTGSFYERSSALWVQIRFWVSQWLYLLRWMELAVLVLFWLTKTKQQLKGVDWQKLCQFVYYVAHI